MSRNYDKLFASRKSALQFIKENIDNNENLLDGSFELSPNEKHQIATLNSGVNNIVNVFDNSIIFSGNTNKVNKSIYNDSSDISTKLYSTFNKKYNLFEELNNISNNAYTPKKQTGIQLINNVSAVNKVHYSRTKQRDMQDFNDVYDSFKKLNNFIDSNKTVIVHDLESLGGINSKGFQQYDMITELSAIAMQGDKEIKKVNTILGFSEKEYNKVLNYIKGLENKSPSEYSNLDNVYLKRLSLFGQDFEYEMNGFNAIGTKANIDVPTSYENAIKGLNKYREIGIKQEEYAKSIGSTFEELKEKAIKEYTDLVYEGKGIKGDFITLGQNTFAFDNPLVSHITGKQFNYKKGQGADLYQAIKYIQENLGPGSHLPNGSMISNNFGIGTQDALKELFNAIDNESSSAHMAYEDTKALYNILNKNINKDTNLNYASFIMDKLDKVKNKMGSTNGTINLSNGSNVFYMDKTAQKSFNTFKNGLSFIYDPIDKSYKTFDGFRIDNTGNINKESYNGFGPKQGGLYKQKVYKIDVNSDEWNSIINSLKLSDDDIEQFYQDYKDIDSLYLLQSQEYNPNTNINTGKIYYQIFTSEDQISTNIGVPVLNIDNNGKLTWNKENLNSLNLVENIIDENGNISINPVTDLNKQKEMLINRSNYRNNVDSAARTIREADYTRLSKLRKYKQNAGISISQKISNLIANNQSLDLNLANELASEFGYLDIAKKAMKISPESISKLPILDKYVEAIDPILSIMEEEWGDNFSVKNINGKTLINSLDSKAEKARKNLVFKNVLTNTLEDITSNLTPQEMGNIIRNSKPGVFTENELMKVDFSIKDIFPELLGESIDYGISGANSKYLSIDLTKNDGLLNPFFNNLYRNVDGISKKGQAGFNALFKAYDVIKEDKRFKGIWEGKLSYNDLKEFQTKGNVSQLNSKMLDILKSYVIDKRTKGDTGFGLKYVRGIQDYSDVSQLSELLKRTPINDLKKSITNNMRNAINNYHILDANSDISSLANELVDNYMMTFTENELLNSITNLTADQQKVLKAQYKISKQEAHNTAEELLKAIKQTNLSIGITGKGKDARLFMMDGGRIKLFDLHKYTLNNGIINYNLNGIDYATNFAIDVSGIINKKGLPIHNANIYDNIKITSNVQKAMNNNISYSSAIKYAENSQEDIMDALLYRIRKNEGILREVGARREHWNYNNTIQRAFDFDANSLISILPELQEAGIISEVEQRFQLTNDKYKKQMSSLINKIKEMKTRPREVSELLANEQNLFYDMYNFPIMSLLFEKIGNNLGDIDGINYAELSKMVNPHVQDVKNAKDIFSLNTSPFAHGSAKYDKSSRSVTNQQGNAILYDKKRMEQDIKELLETSPGKSKEVLKNLSVGNKISNVAGEQFVNNVKQGNKTLTAGVTLKALQIDSNSLKNIFINDVEKARNGEANKFTEFLNAQYNGIENVSSAKLFAEKAMGLSTYQQESIVNARVSYIAMNQNNKQMINKKKKLIIEHSENLNVIDSIKNASKLNFVIKDGKIQYQLGYEVKRGQILGVFGDNETITSRFNGIFRGRYYDEFGNIVSELDLNNSLNGVTSYDEAKRILDKKYNFGFEVIQKYEEYGHKLYNGASEKSTANVADIGLGLIDTNLEKKLISYGLGNDIGKVYSREYLEEYMLPSLVQNGTLTAKEAKDLRKQILKERFSFSDMLSSEYTEFNGVGQFLAVNTKKHQSISFASNDIYERILRSDLSEDDRLSVTKAIFGKDITIKEDGTLLLDNSKRLIIGEDRLKKILGNELGDKAWNILNNVEELKNGNGHYVYSNVLHAYDDPSGTFAGNLNYDKAIKDLKQAKELGNTELVKKIEEEIAALDRQKGLKFDNRMNLNLQRQVYNADNFDLVKQNLSSEMFEKYFGHYYENGKLSDKYLGKRVLDPVISDIMNHSRLGYGEKSLAKASNKRYDYLKKTFSKIQDKISVDYAEKAYSYAQGKKALLFNKQTHISEESVNRLNNVKDEFNKFKLIDVSNLSPNDVNGWLDLDIGGQGRSVANAPNNPYTNNILLKTGLKDDGYQYLAIARMPEKHFEENMIASSHIHKLTEIQRGLKQYNSTVGEEKESAKNYVKNLIDEFVDLQKRDITGKEGLAGELISSRFKQSVFGTGSGYSINYINSLGKDSIETLRKINSKTFLDTATFNGKSILEHYSNGLALDVVGLSEEAFEKMGYFKESFIKQHLGENKTIEDMKTYLRTKGDMFFLTRFPRIQEGSDKVALGYLVDDLKHNQMVTVGYTAESMNLDFDGDKFAAARITDYKGHSYMDYLNGKAEYDDYMKAQEVSLISRGATTNKYWDSVYRKQIEKESKIAKDGSRIIDLAKESLIDGEVYSPILNFKDASALEYAKYLNNDEYKYLVKDTIESGEGHDKAINYLKNRAQETGKDFSVMKNEYAKAYAYQLYQDEIIAKAAKNSIGEINVTNTKLRSMLETLSDNLYEGAEYKSSLIANMMHESEQAAISSKTSISGLSPDRAKEWNEHARALIFNKGNVEEHKKTLLDWGNKYLINDVEPMEYYQRSSYFRNLVADRYNNGKMFTEEEFSNFAKDNTKLRQDIVSDFVNSIDEIRTQTNSQVLEDFYNNLSIGQSSTGVTKPLNSPTSSSKLLRQTPDMLFDTLNNASEDIRPTNMQYLEKPISSKSTRENLLDSLVSNKENIEANTSKISEKILTGTKDMFKTVKGSNIAMGALGIAAGVMMLGYAGGRPRPANTQAMEEANDYPTPNLMDPNITTVMPNMNNRGYVVNINARTNKSRQDVINALQQAISNGTNSSINISMNINDNMGNITDRDIERMFDDAIS